MHRPLLAALLSAAILTPALAQSPVDQRRWQAAQARYQAETDRYYAERDRFYAARGQGRGGYSGGGYQSDGGAGGYPNGGYGAPPPRGYAAPRGDVAPSGDFTTDYDASAHYREGPGYQERVLAENDRVYRGSDGRAYCERGDGTTGLIVGGAAGGIFGNVIDGGRNRTAGTLIGGALGALIGRSAQQQNQQVRCR